MEWPADGDPDGDVRHPGHQRKNGDNRRQDGGYSDAENSVECPPYYRPSATFEPEIELPTAKAVGFSVDFRSGLS